MLASIAFSSQRSSTFCAATSSSKPPCLATSLCSLWCMPSAPGLLVTHAQGTLPWVRRSTCRGGGASIPAVELAGRPADSGRVNLFFIAWMSEILDRSVEQAAEATGMSNVFVGIIVVASMGNAAEHSTAVLVAIKNRMDLSFGIALGSSTQIALFVAPLLVFLSYDIGPQAMDLVFMRGEVLAVILSTFMMAFAAGDGRSNWFMGAQLLAVYLILAVALYFTPG